MSNNINTQSGERLSFYKLYKEKGYRILIPIIQRDYAQGRKSKEEVRNTFLDALYNYLEENKPNRDLDFVYGSLEVENNITNFIPLDGQQRLTTLFLLHWYLYQISEESNNTVLFKETLLKDEKSMFTYETRSSSSEFCDAIMSNDINTFLEPDKDSEGNSLNNSISKTIKNSSWFYLSWKYDPTIQSMLTMLDAIHIRFNNKQVFFDRLLDLDNPIITFLFLNLKEFKLTDDLYIKMNSRGKPLTSFENFKAKFEQYIETIKQDKIFNLDFNNVKKEVSLNEYFSFNIDTKWANLFWHYRTLQNRTNSKIDDSYDDELMNFIRVIFTYRYASIVNITSKDKDDTLEYLLGTNLARKNKEYSDVISFHKYDELKVLTQDEKQKKQATDYTLYLIDAFDVFVNGNKKLEIFLSDDYKFYFDANKAFENALKHDFESNHERICFYAYTGFLITNKDDRTGIDQWMRIIHNLTHPDNTIIDNANIVSNAIKSIEELLPFSNNILEHIKKDETSISLFSSWQTLEEKIKAHLIIKDDKWKNKIEVTEKHGYFNGQIGFILEFAGILDYYKTHNNCNWNDHEDEKYFDIFCDYSEKAINVFKNSYENRVNDEDFVFERAVLTKGNYLTTASRHRKNLLSTNLTKNNIKRDHSWKRLLRITGDKVWEEKRTFVKQVFDDNRFDINDLKDSLNSICSDVTNTWRDYFISCPDLIKHCNQGFIRFENKNNILLYKESQSNHLHRELYTYHLWKTLIESKKESYLPFKNIYYSKVKGIENEPCIVMSNFSFNEINYKLAIYYNNDDSLPMPYEIKFYKSSGENIPKEYDTEIIHILDSLDYKWENDYNGYFTTYDTKEDLMNSLEITINKLNDISSK